MAVVVPAEYRSLVAQVGGAVERVREEIAGIWSESTRRTQETAAGTLYRAFDSWSTTQLEEVLTGKREPQRWIDWGKELIQIAASFAADAGSFLVRYSSLIDVLGNAAQAVKNLWDSQVQKIAELGQQLVAFRKERELLLKQRKDLEGKPLSEEVRDLVYGAQAQQALAELGRFELVVQALQSAMSLVKSGGARLESDGSGDLRVVPTTQLGAAVLLGAVPALAAGTVVATVAVAAALAVSLQSYFRTKNEKLSTELARLELELVADGKAEDVKKLRELRNETEKARAPDSIGAAVSIAKVIGTAVAIGAGVYALKLAVDAFAPRARASA